jgi:hypothetical protein
MQKTCHFKSKVFGAKMSSRVVSNVESRFFKRMIEAREN